MQITINLQVFLFIILFILTRQIEFYALIMFFALIHEFRTYFCRITFKIKTKKINLSNSLLKFIVNISLSSKTSITLVFWGIIGLNPSLM